MLAKATRSLCQQVPRAGKIAQLCHGDATQSQGGGVISQRDPIEGAQHIAGGKRQRRSVENGIHETGKVDDAAAP